MALTIFLIFILFTSVFLNVFILWQINNLKTIFCDVMEDIYDQAHVIRGKQITKEDLESFFDKFKQAEIKNSEEKWKNFQKAFGGHREKEDG